MRHFIQYGSREGTKTQARCVLGAMTRHTIVCEACKSAKARCSLAADADTRDTVYEPCERCVRLGLVCVKATPPPARGGTEAIGNHCNSCGPGKVCAVVGRGQPARSTAVVDTSAHKRARGFRKTLLGHRTVGPTLPCERPECCNH